VGESTLYEVTEPSTKSVAAQGRRLVLPRQAFPKSRSDLAAIDANDPDLKYPPGKGPNDPFPPWKARAAKSAY
jgi:hypothetical protein